jgi:hypothetical protein
MVAEGTGPRLVSQVAVCVLVMMHRLRPVAHDDLDAETRKNRAVPVRPGRRRYDGQGPEGGREQKLLTHGSSPSKCSQACPEPASRHLNDV